MTWQDAIKIGAVMLGGLGGGAVIFAALTKWFADVWTNRLSENHRHETEKALLDARGRLDVGLQRLEHALGHRSFVRQRFAEMELEGIRECWQNARACLPAINAPRAVDSGMDLGELSTRTEALRQAHNALLEVLGKHEPFLSEQFVTPLEDIRQVAALELSHIAHHPKFQRQSRESNEDWWDEGRKNQLLMKEKTDALKLRVKARIEELTSGEE